MGRLFLFNVQPEITTPTIPLPPPTDQLTEIRKRSREKKPEKKAFAELACC